MGRRGVNKPGCGAGSPLIHGTAASGLRVYVLRVGRPVFANVV
jgi:hypothetical protein